MAKAFKTRFLCARCDKMHDDQSSAELCCIPEAIPVFVCELCEVSHDTKTEAAACCTRTDRRVSDQQLRTELEARGQTRLVE